MGDRSAADRIFNAKLELKNIFHIEYNGYKLRQIVV